MDLLKQFSRDDLAEIVRIMIGDNPNIPLAKDILDGLHRLKYRRLVLSYNKRVDEGKDKYERYRRKAIPKSKQNDFDKFVKSFEKLEKEVVTEKKIILERGLIREEDK